MLGHTVSLLRTFIARYVPLCLCCAKWTDPKDPVPMVFMTSKASRPNCLYIVIDSTNILNNRREQEEVTCLHDQWSMRPMISFHMLSLFTKVYALFVHINMASVCEILRQISDVSNLRCIYKSLPTRAYCLSTCTCTCIFVAF